MAEANKETPIKEAIKEAEPAPAASEPKEDIDDLLGER
jgi:hypothetical protein